MTCTCPACGSPLVDDGSVRLDLESGIVVGGGHAASLTRQEAALFTALWLARPRVLSKERLLEATADVGFDDREIKIVDVFICRIRKKLSPLGVEISTVRGQGYRVIGARKHE